MKTITFFSEKGGVGKSSISIMFASWLKHNHGVKVGFADFNNRITFYRESEIRERKNFIKNNPDTDILPFDESKTWPIVNAYSREIEPYEQRRCPYAAWFQDEYIKGKLKGFDVVVCDFGGSLNAPEFSNLLAMKQLNLVVIPTERDEMTLTSTMRMAGILSNVNANYCCFINKANLLRNYKGQYIRLGQGLTKKGIRMLPDMVTFSERMKTIDKVDILRSTFGYPDFTKGEYKKISDLGMENLFIDVAKELNRTKDLPGTDPANLSFVGTLVKHEDERQFKGSAFPEYEKFIQ